MVATGNAIDITTLIAALRLHDWSPVNPDEFAPGRRRRRRRRDTAEAGGETRVRKL